MKRTSSLVVTASVLALAACGNHSSRPAAVQGDVDMARSGPNFEDPDLAMDQAHTHGNLVTAPAWPAHPAWLAQFLDVLGTRIKP